MARSKKASSKKVSSPKASSPALSTLIRQNLTSFLLGILVILVLVGASVQYITSLNKKIAPTLFTGVFTGSPTPAPRVDNNIHAETYRVKAGDDLCQIARAATGDCKNGYEIAKQNNIADPNRIEIGQELRVPSRGEITPSAVADTNTIANTEPTEKSSVYIVKQGDYLWQIAQGEYGDPHKWILIAEANNLVDPNFLSIGSKLQIPR